MDGILLYPPKLPTWSGTLANGATKRLPPVRCDGRTELRLFVATNHDLSVSIAMGRASDTPQTTEAGAASLPWATAAATAATTSGAETGAPINFQLYGSPEWCQVVISNASGSSATVRVDGGLV